MIQKVLNGSQVELLAPKAEILNLWKSAANHGAIEVDASVSEFCPTDKDLLNHVLNQVGRETFCFSLSIKNLLRWREAIESLRFDPNRLETPALASYLHAKAEAWFNALPTTSYRHHLAK